VPDLVVLDLNMPEEDGLSIIRDLKSRINVPVIMLTATASPIDRVVGLELGADDYVTKPFSPRELTARVRTVLRRSMPQPLLDERLSFEWLEIDLRRREVVKRGCSLALTAKEFDLLCFLARYPRQVFSRDQLMDRVWGYEAALDTGTVTVHMRRLREKIEDDPAHPQRLQTVWGVGYRFVP
jgi:DNA-binding response OmpR family regulator